MVRSDYQKYLSDERTHLFQILVGVCSILLGMLLAGAVIHLLPQDVSSIEKARELGIISQTVLDRYPKELEVPYYILGVVVSIAVGMCIFLAVTYFHYRKKGARLASEESHPTPDVEKPKPAMGLVRWAVLTLVLFLVTFHTDFIYKNWYWAKWGFFFEEGVYLRWINELLRGNILYKDVYFYNAPFMIWPQYWLMKLFGPSIALHRYYIYFFYLLGYLIVFKVLRQLVRNKMLVLVGMIPIVYFYYPMFPGVHQSLGRYAVSLLPLYFLYKSFFSRRSLHLLISGGLVGFALVFSEELGVGSLVATVAMLVVFCYRERKTITDFLRQLALLIIGALVPLVPVLAYFFFHHAMADLYEATVNVPRYYAMGAWGLEFPNLYQLLTRSYENKYDTFETLLAYWPIVFYIGSVFFCLTLFLRRSFPNRAILFFGIAALGGIMFQRGFGIYSLMTIKNVLYPLMILSIGYLDMVWPRVRILISNKGMHSRYVEMLLYAALVAFIISGLLGYSGFRAYSPSRPPYDYLAGLSERSENYVALDLPRARGVYIPPERAYITKTVVDYITWKTAPDEPIFVFPYSPMYYFLADRPSASKYPAIYAIPQKYREQVVEELEKKKVNYIIYVTRGPFLGLTIDTRFPEIQSYLGKNYQTEKSFDDTFILRRKHRPEH